MKYLKVGFIGDKTKGLQLLMRDYKRMFGDGFDESKVEEETHGRLIILSYPHPLEGTNGQ